MLEEYTIIEAVVTIAVFAGIGISANFSRYRDKIGDDPEEWQLAKAAPLLLVGTGGGVLAFALGLPADVTVIGGVIGGLIPIVDELRTGKVSFLETYRVARGKGKSQMESAAKAGRAASSEVDGSRIRGGTEKINDAVEQTEGPTPEPANESDPRGEKTTRDGG